MSVLYCCTFLYFLKKKISFSIWSIFVLFQNAEFNPGLLFHNFGKLSNVMRTCSIATCLSTIEPLYLQSWVVPRTTDTQWRYKSKISEELGRCGRQNMLRLCLKIWDWDWIFGRAVKAISSLGIRSPWNDQKITNDLNSSYQS